MRPEVTKDCKSNVLLTDLGHNLATKRTSDQIT